MNNLATRLLVTEENDDEIRQDKVVRLGFHVTERGSGELLQYGDDLVYLHGGYGGAFPKVEFAMEGCRVGDRVEVSLAPEDGYGQRRPELLLEVPAAEFGEELPPAGTAVEGELPDGRSMTFTVAGFSNGHIALDGNHPFAGKHLDFRFEVLEIRDSSEAERAAGFAFDDMFL
ncbi:MAG TPA: hypothetical protein ENK05_00305 [Gammaproteobacteria bacterium]|nr:hypothetical protein [Gammaproteobacteria bacterium]